jgi:hypothetical protein
VPFCLPYAKKTAPYDIGRRINTVLFGVLMAVGPVVTGTQEAPADPPSVKEYQVKAAFLYNFAKFIEWPDSAFADEHAPICIGIVGHDPFGEAFNGISTKTVQARPLEIRRFQSVQDIKFCHILFISPSEKEHLASLLSILQERSMLTVSETAHFAQAGGMVNFIVRGKKIRLEINPLSAKRAGLKISSKLLQLATIIVSDPTSEPSSLETAPVYPLEAIGR